MLLQPSSATSGLHGGIKAAIFCDPSSMILKFLQQVDVFRPSTTLDRATSIENGAWKYLCKECSNLPYAERI